MSTIPTAMQHHIKQLMLGDQSPSTPRRQGVALPGQTLFVATILNNDATGILTAGEQYVASNDPHDPLVAHIWCHVSDPKPLGMTQPLENIRFSRWLFNSVLPDTVKA